MKKRFIFLVLYIIFCNIPVIAVDWIPFADNWFIDIDNIEKEKDCAGVWTKVNVHNKNIKAENKQQIEWIVYHDILIKNTHLHLTITEITYNIKGESLENYSYPYGEEPNEYPPGSTLEIIRDIAFMNTEDFKNMSDIMKMGLLKYFSPYIKVDINKSNKNFDESSHDSGTLDEEFKQILNLNK